MVDRADKYRPSCQWYIIIFLIVCFHASYFQWWLVIIKTLTGSSVLMNLSLWWFFKDFTNRNNVGLSYWHIKATISIYIRHNAFLYLWLMQWYPGISPQAIRAKTWQPIWAVSHLVGEHFLLVSLWISVTSQLSC